MNTLIQGVARLGALAIAAGALAACSSTGPRGLGGNPQASCAALVAPVAASAIGLPSGAASIDSAALVAASELAIAERGATPASRITPALPAHCRVMGRIAPLDASAPPILFQLNLPVQWNGRSVQFGGGGFNGVLVTGLSLVPGARFDQPAPLAQGYATYGTDSGHQNVAGQPPQIFALNDEALENFAHASYKKVRDVAVALMQRAYGRAPEKLYFVGSSEGGREGLMMAQRYPRDFDGVFSRVPVINWTGLQHAGLRNGLAIMGDGWLNPAQVRKVHEATLAACDAADGLADGVVSDATSCLRSFDVATLRCAAGASADSCLNEAQIQAVRQLRAAWISPVPLAHGVNRYPGWGIGGEGTAASGPTGGWGAWWTGTAAPAQPPVPSNGIAWVYGGGAIQYIYARNAQLDLRRYDPLQHADRIAQVSQLMDATSTDLTAFHARGGKIIMLEHLSDYAQSPYAGMAYHEAVTQRLGRRTVDSFMRLYSAPGVDHVGSGAPANVDMLSALAGWVEQGKPPAGLQLVEQEVKAGFAVTRARPLCEWPLWPRYGRGDAAQASSFQCVR